MEKITLSVSAKLPRRPLRHDGRNANQQMPDYFASPRNKLARAKKYIADLETERNRFINDQPWSRVVEVNRDRGTKEFKIKFTRDIPDVFSDLTSNVLHNLRAALEHAANAAARASGIAAPKNAYFPFADNAAELERQIKGRCKDVPTDIVAVFRTFIPYRAGNPVFWAINLAANIDKHAVSVGITGGLDAVVFRGPNTATRPLTVIPPRFDARKNEIVYAVCGPEMTPDCDLHPVVDVTFGEIDIVGGHPVLRVLNAMANEVHNVLVAVEAKSRLLFPPLLSEMSSFISSL
jgi:hypothetical protein